jgi:hypothetical protein
MPDKVRALSILGFRFETEATGGSIASELELDSA